MKKILLPMMALSFIGLTACSEKIAEQAVYTGGNTLAVAEQAAAQYAAGDFGTPKKDVLENIEKYDNAANDAVSKVVTDAKAGNALTSTEQEAASTAITAFTTYLASQGISVKSSN